MRGVAWRSVAWCVVRRGVVWPGAWCAVVWCGLVRGVTWRIVAWCVVWRSVAWCVVWRGVACRMWYVVCGVCVRACVPREFITEFLPNSQVYL